MIGVILVAAIGAVLVFASFNRWRKEQRPDEQMALRGGTERDVVRGVLFGLWTIVLPLGFLIAWYWPGHPHPEPKDLAEYQYAYKLWSDLWAAFAVVLGIPLCEKVLTRLTFGRGAGARAVAFEIARNRSHGVVASKTGPSPSGGKRG